MTEASPEPQPVEAQTRPIAEPNSDEESRSSSPELPAATQKGKDPEPNVNDGNEAAAPVDIAESKPEKHADFDDADDDDEEENDEEENDEEEDDEEVDEDDEDDEDDDEDDEPRLKYARLTQHLGPIYRNGDATSAFLVAGDKMIIGTHNGAIHVIQLPMFQSLRVYKVHTASVTSISISPNPPPLPTARSEAVQRLAAEAADNVSKRPQSQQSGSPAAASRRPREPTPIPNTPSNNIHVATSSMDGNVCVFSLTDTKDVHVRNFHRPVQAVALSPDFKNDRTYLSGGLAGQLILTAGAQRGQSTSTTVGTAAAAASGWLGSVGLGTNTAKDSILHSGEGTIGTIKWSLSGKYVVWLNEHGVKIMRSKLHLDSSDSEDAWKRIGHIDRPQTDEWETMASAWKGRAEWIDEQAVETDDAEAAPPADVATTPAAESLKQQATASNKRIERLVVGWGGTIWIIHVHPGSPAIGKREKTMGRAEIAKHLRMDCIISGISLYTPNLLLVLAYVLPDEDDSEDEDAVVGKGHKSKPSTTSTGSEPSGGIKRRQNHLPPELRLIDLTSQAEVDKDGLSVSRYERLTSGDYHLGVLPAQNAASAVASSKGALDAIAGFGSDVWNAAINPRTLFSSGASIRSRNSGDDVSSTQVPSMASVMRKQPAPTVHPNLVKPGVKIFIHSPFDFILATKRDLGDHLAWLLEHQEYQKAWELLDEHPEIMTSPPENLSELVPTTPDKKQGSQDDLLDDGSSVMGSVMGSTGPAKNPDSSAEKEKRHIGELWVRELIEAGNWVEAGRVCGKVLGSSDRWEKWVWTFAGADKFDEITNYIPSEPMYPPIPGTIYEVVLNHYIQVDKLRFRELLDRWTPDLFDIKTVTTALENQLKYRDVSEDSVEGGERGRDWKIVMESLARLHEANGRFRESLKGYIKLQDADNAFRLIRDNHLAEAVADDIPSFIGLRVPADRKFMGPDDFEAATSEAITLLVDEAQHGLVKPQAVVSQLLDKDMKLYLFFYLRGLYKGDGIEEHTAETRDRLLMDSQSLVDDFADLAVQLFAANDRELLMSFLKSSTSYVFEKAVQECEKYKYDDELVHLYSKTGQTKRALYLIIDRLKDVKKAIEFAKLQDDPDLWDDLLDYSMDKPMFIRGLLEEVGTAINPIKLVRRIPEGLEIEGLREGLKHIMKEHEIQHSISSGVAKVLRSEVAAAQSELRSGQRKGIKFEVVVQSKEHVDVQVKDVAHPPVKAEEIEESFLQAKKTEQPGHTHQPPEPGHCAQCHESFTEYEMETLWESENDMACWDTCPKSGPKRLIYGV
ncbi:Vacuolar protein sorting-associated protein 41-like protein [Colletotrichum orbiculare MAFF 240422]|uniref:Vacuolar protein sorting-associated protein 41-like protein n=1 Tax=Colletotrichum orbiculare (strain 104-T / ATCC 96160 / CBS 514.97 / LARS 414 / MAFF 240422) TaxID=1213857 RepID=A0A484FB26_COLOR|nr:Vacuolar protein sorting-associated protein 41-like protein [Colletotrichum orbiculare MAFF 240422]